MATVAEKLKEGLGLIDAGTKVLGAGPFDWYAGQPDICQPCRADHFRQYREERKSNGKARAAYLRRRPKQLADALKRLHGLTPAEFDQMAAEQGGVCAICKQADPVVDVRYGSPRRLSVDHDHTTGKVRGLLCAMCNQGLGHFYERIELFYAAIEYLERHRQQDDEEALRAAAGRADG